MCKLIFKRQFNGFTIIRPKCINFKQQMLNNCSSCFQFGVATTRNIKPLYLLDSEKPILVQKQQK